MAIKSNFTLSTYFTRPLLTVLCLGFSSGLPLALTASTLSAWLFEAHVDKSTIGLFAAVATPYTLKFLWAPLMDSLRFPVLTKMLGRRRGWMLATQFALVASLLLLAAASPAINPWATAAVALLVSFCSASQDIVIDAYRVESLTKEEQGEGAAMIQLGYRIGMIAATAGALYLADMMGWRMTYIIMSALMGIGIATTLLAKEPGAKEFKKPRDFTGWLRTAVIAPLKDFTKQPAWIQILVFIIIYRLADAFIGSMTNPFLLELGFQKKDIAAIVKFYGIVATLLGTFAGGSLTARFGALRILFLGGLLHGATNLCYVWQAHAGADSTVLAVSTFLENFTGGLATAAFVAYLSNLCNVHYTATQYALLSSLSALGRTWLSTPAGYVAQSLGWSWFFALSALLALPGLALLLILNKRLGVIAVLIGALFISQPASAAENSCLVGIDIGHMRDLPGATSARGVTELQYNTVLANRLNKYLNNLGIPSVILNPDGEYMALHERPQRAEKAGATLFISIHHDSTPRPMSVWQWEGYNYAYNDNTSGYGLFVSKANPRFKESLRLAKEMGDKLLASGLKPNLSHAAHIRGEERPLLDKKRGVYQYNNLVVLMRAPMPAILVESGVIVNRDEELQVRTPEYQDKIISAIAAAAIDHCNRVKG